VFFKPFIQLTQKTFSNSITNQAGKRNL